MLTDFRTTPSDIDCTSFIPLDSRAPPVTLQPTSVPVGSTHPFHWPLILYNSIPKTSPQDPHLHSINSALQPRPQSPGHAPNFRSDPLSYDSWVPRQASLTLTRTRTTSRSSSSTAAAVWAAPTGEGAAEHAKSEAAEVVAIPPLSSLSRGQLIVAPTLVVHPTVRAAAAPPCTRAQAQRLLYDPAPPTWLGLEVL